MGDTEPSYRVAETLTETPVTSSVVRGGTGPGTDRGPKVLLRVDTEADTVPTLRPPETVRVPDSKDRRH